MTLLQPSNSIAHGPSRVGIFAPAGAGKSITSVMIAVGISTELCNRSPIAFVDPEGVAEFVKPICDAEGVPLFVVQARSFLEMRESLTEAEDAGCSVFVVDHYDGLHRELTEAQKTALNLQGRKLPYHHREELIRIWEAWVAQFKSSPCHTIFNGRLAWNWGEAESEDGEIEKVKLGTKMRGEADAGYEPNLLIELEAIQDKEKRDRKTRSKQGSIVHWMRILKDRRMVLNGRSFASKDLNAYTQGDYQIVWRPLAPHFRGTGVGVVRPQGAPRSSGSLFSAPPGESQFARDAQRRQIAIEEIQAALNTIWPGSTQEEKRLKHVVMQTVFKSRSWEAIGSMTPEALETAWLVMRHFEAAALDINVRDEAAVVDLIQSCKDLEAARTEASVL